MNKYTIFRFYADDRRRKIIKEHLTLEEAQEHCEGNKNHKKGKWFDGYDYDIK